MRVPFLFIVLLRLHCIFLCRVPDRNPRIEWGCQPVFSQSSIRLTPDFRLSKEMMFCFLEVICFFGWANLGVFWLVVFVCCLLFSLVIDISSWLLPQLIWSLYQPKTRQRVMVREKCSQQQQCFLLTTSQEQDRAIEMEKGCGYNWRWVSSRVML